MKVFQVIIEITAALGIAQAAPQNSNCDDIVDHAKKGIESLLDMYNSDNGLWGDDVEDFNGWWNSGNMINIIGDYAALFPSQISNLDQKVFSNTFYKAQEYALKLKNDSDGLNQLHNTHPTPAIKNGFTREYFDDDGWWVQAWIQAYDLTKNSEYLKAAEYLHEHIVTGWTDEKCNGGVFWNEDRKYKNAIANELFLHTSALLAQRANDKTLKSKSYYLDWAKKEYKWFVHSGMINPNHTISDGLNDNCRNNDENGWSYNQGVILGGLVELDRVESNPEYILLAKSIADAGIKKLTDGDGIVHDACEPTCWQSGDAPQFKGIFTRNLAVLYDYVYKKDYKDLIIKNAQSIWDHDRNTENQFGGMWSGPLTPITPQTHSSALDTLVGAVDVGNCREHKNGHLGDWWSGTQNQGGWIYVAGSHDG